MKKACVCCFILSIVFINCKNQKENLSANRVQYNATLTDSFFFKNEWSYPSLTVKIGEGKFDNGYGGKISAEDTAHLYHTASIVTMFDSIHNEEFLKENSFDYKIDYGEAFLIGDSLSLKFYESTPSSYDDLIIKIINKSFNSTYKSGSPPTGNRDYYFEGQKLILQKEHYVKGDTIKGYLDFQGHSPKFVHLKGAFKMLVN
jgi:hypothetical protein